MKDTIIEAISISMKSTNQDLLRQSLEQRPISVHRRTDHVAAPLQIDRGIFLIARNDDAFPS